MTCFFRHRWNRWEIGPTTLASGHQVLAQSRGCRRCGKTEMEILMAETPGSSLPNQIIKTLDA